MSRSLPQSEMRLGLHIFESNLTPLFWVYLLLEVSKNKSFNYMRKERTIQKWYIHISSHDSGCTDYANTAIELLHPDIKVYNENNILLRFQSETASSSSNIPSSSSSSWNTNINDERYIHDDSPFEPLTKKFFQTVSAIGNQEPQVQY